MELPHIFIFTCQRSYLTRGELAMKVGRTVGGGGGFAALTLGVEE